MVKLPVTKNFNSKDVVGVYDGDSGAVRLLVPMDIDKFHLALGYSIDPKDIKEENGVRIVRKMTVHEVSLVFTQNRKIEE